MNSDDDLFGDDIFDQEAIEAIDARVNLFTGSQMVSQESSMINQNVSITGPSTFSTVNIPNLVVTEKTDQVDPMEMERLRQTVERLTFELGRKERQLTEKDQELRAAKLSQTQERELDRLKRQLAVRKHNETVSTPRKKPAIEQNYVRSSPRPIVSKQQTSQASQMSHAPQTSQISHTPQISQMSQTSQLSQLSHTPQISQMPQSPPIIHFQTETTETEEATNLLKILLGPIFQRWNIEHHQNRLDFSISLTPDRLKKFSQMFSEQFIPTTPSQSKKTLTLFASNLADYIIKCESASVTVPLILNTLGACLHICIQEKHFKILKNICLVIRTLTGTFEDTAYYLYRDSTLGTSSTLYKLAQALGLYCFYDKPLMQVIQDHPNIVNKPYTEIVVICNHYNVTPVEITDDLNKKRKPEFAEETVYNILKIFSYVALETDDTLLSILIKADGFKDLLSSETPMKIIEECLMLIQIVDKNKEQLIPLIPLLTPLITLQQGHYTVEQWHKIRRMVTSCLYDMVKAKIILERTVLETLTLNAGEIMENMQNATLYTATILQEESDLILHFTFKILLLVIKLDPKVVIENKKFNLDMLTSFISKVCDYLDDTFFSYKSFKQLEKYVASL